MVTLETRTPELDGLVHHWKQGPQNLVPLYAPITYWNRHWEWQFCWFLETPDAIPGVSPATVRDQVDYILNKHGLGWHRTGVHFSEVTDIAKAQIVLRFTDTPPAQWPNMTNFLGVYYHDAAIGKNVAQVTARRVYFDHPATLAYTVGHELAGHGCFRMWDMYIPEHEPYALGNMGGGNAALANFGYPTTQEIDCGQAWLRGEAVHVHDHPQFTVPEAEHPH